MADTLTTIRERRTIRQYEDRPVTDELLNQVLAAVQWSPSWANTQCWEVVAVRDGGTKAQLQDAVGATNPAYRALAEAPVVLALCGKLEKAGYYKGVSSTKFGDWFMFDLGIATQSLCLAAHSLGLGTVVIGLLDHEKAAKVLKTPAGVELVVLIPLGFPVKIPLAPRRRTLEEFTHQEGF